MPFSASRKKKHDAQMEVPRHSGDDLSSSDEDVNKPPPFSSPCEALEARKEALRYYNAEAYDEAMKIQYRVLRYFIRHHKGGATHPANGLYFLDYGLSQLRLLQRLQLDPSGKPEENIFSPEMQQEREDCMEACFVNLEIARVCFQKQSSAWEAAARDGTAAPDSGVLVDDPSGAAVPLAQRRREAELTVAEVHNALAQLLVEKGDYAAALSEFDAELLLYTCLEEEGDAALPALAAGRRISCMYGAADCLLKEANFEAAEERLQQTLQYIQEHCKDAIDPALVEDLKDWLEDAREMKDGKYSAVREEIQEQFSRTQMVNMLQVTAQHKEEEGGVSEEDEEDSDEDSDNGEESKTYTHSSFVSHPFIAPLPLTDGGANSSSFGSAMAPVVGSSVGLGLNEHSRSTSLFPSQSISGVEGHRKRPRSPSGNSPAVQDLHTAVVKKKPKK